MQTLAAQTAVLWTMQERRRLFLLGVSAGRRWLLKHEKSIEIGEDSELMKYLISKMVCFIFNRMV